MTAVNFVRSKKVRTKPISKQFYFLGLLENLSLGKRIRCAYYLVDVYLLH